MQPSQALWPYLEFWESLRLYDDSTVHCTSVSGCDGLDHELYDSFRLYHDFYHKLYDRLRHCDDPNHEFYDSLRLYDDPGREFHDSFRLCASLPHIFDRLRLRAPP